jgi:predicted RND superfamily exporter protein
MPIGSTIVAKSVSHHKAVTLAVVVVTVLLAVLAAVPSIWPEAVPFLHAIEVDTDPENMLSPDEPVRVFHSAMKKRLALHDMVVVGVVNEQHASGVFNARSLQKVYELAAFAKTLRGRRIGKPAGEGVIEVDLISLSTVDTIEPIRTPDGRSGGVSFSYLMAQPPATDGEALEVWRKARRIPFLFGTVISDKEPAKPSKAVALYLPLTAKDASHNVYTALQQRAPILWLWGPLRAGLDRLDLGDRKRNDALIRLGRLAAYSAADRGEFERLLTRTTERLARGTIPWRAHAMLLRGWSGEAKQLDERAQQRLRRLREGGASEADLARARSECAAAAHRWLVGQLAAPADEALGLRYVLMHVGSLADRELGAADLLAAAAAFADETHAALAAEGGAKAYAALPGTVAKAIAAETDFPGADAYHVTGLPVAEDTFGVEMFWQMAISAPAAMVVIFLLMLAFFRKLVVVISPMIVAMASVVLTMGALIVAGFPIHIMSSMIPIFIMPIAVLDSIHIISEFFERYQATRDRRKTILAVMDELFVPMLYTSLTSAAGFASLALTPIPPVQVFGVFVAIGIMVAWLLTVTFIPAYVMLLRPAALANFGAKHAAEAAAEDRTALGRALRWTAGATFRRAKPILAVAMVVLVVAGYGISRININDNPVKWFTPSHPIRRADRVLNDHFGGTYMAYLAMEAEPAVAKHPADFVSVHVSRPAKRRVGAIKATLGRLGAAAEAVAGDARDAENFFARLKQKLRPGRSDATDEQLSVWRYVERFLDVEAEEAGGRLDAKQYPARLRARADREADRLAAEFGKLDRLAWEVASTKLRPVDVMLADLARKLSPGRVRPAPESAAPGAGQGEPGLPAGAGERQEEPGLPAGAGQEEPPLPTVGEAATKPAAPKPDPYARAAREELALFVDELRQSGQVFKRPDVLAWMGRLQEAMSATGIVGKSNSLAEMVKTVHRDLLSGEEADYRLPANRTTVGQCLIQYQNSHRPDDLWHFVTPDYRLSSVWVQLTSGDNRDMTRVADAVSRFAADHPAPVPLRPRWFGLTYINVEWQEKMVTGMLEAFGGSFLVVFLLMTILFRSALWGLLSMIPLTVTIAAIYGVVGLVGKDYDMPVAVLSSLTLGLAVDFAIHFLARSRAMYAAGGTWQRTVPNVFGEPARAIARNIIVIAAGFLPLLLAPLMPYKTVGALLAIILLVSGIATLLLLPAMVRLLERRLFAAAKKPMPASCNCGLCIVSAIALVVLIALNIRAYVPWHWTTLTWVAAAVVPVAALICGLTSRRRKCKLQAASQGEAE